VNAGEVACVLRAGQHGDRLHQFRVRRQRPVYVGVGAQMFASGIASA